MNKLLLCFLLFFPSYLLGQNYETEARAAYLLAEESYARGDYNAALKFLNLSKKNLGMFNSKMLYLKIQTELELLKADKEYYDIVLTSIKEFQSAPDIKGFNEEKKLEVSKAKMRIIDEREQELNQKRAAAEAQSKLDAHFRQYSFKGWPFGLTFDELQLSHKDSLFFKKRGKDRNEKDKNLVFHYHGGVTFTPPHYMNKIPNFFSEKNVFGILTRENLVKGYRKVVYYQFRPTAKVSYAQTATDIQALVHSLSTEFGFAPEEKKAFYGNGYNCYTWNKGYKIITLYTMRWSYRKNWESSAVMEILER